VLRQLIDASANDDLAFIHRIKTPRNRRRRAAPSDQLK
jgi:hypothetical protein